jgi:hypothetical protein
MLHYYFVIDEAGMKPEKTRQEQYIWNCLVEKEPLRLLASCM